LTAVKQSRNLLVASFAVIAIAVTGVSVAATASAAPGDQAAGISLSAKTRKQLTARARKQAKTKAKRACRKKSGKAKKACIRRKSRKLQKRIFKRLVRQLPGKPAPKINAKAKFKAAGSVGDAYVTGAVEGDRLILANADDRIVATGKADSYGSKVFYGIRPQAGYTVRVRKNGKVFGSKKFNVLKPGANPRQSFYRNQQLKPGFNYMKMRDGIKLAVTVKIPTGTMPAGGWPVLIEHSGYGTAAPHDLLTAILSGQPDPLAPDTSTAVGALIGPQMKFATMSVQMRGSGCSGGAYGLFDLPTTYDGYDMVEIAGNQDWSSGKVGMVGISYSGISQLFAAGTQPPHLKAITPMSVTTDLYAGTGYPGGMFNNGFAQGWIQDRVNDARPAPDGGQQWSRVMATTGDPKVAEPLRSQQKQQCLDNQNLRLQTRDVFRMIEDNPFRTPAIFDNRSPGKWLAKTKVPTFFVGSFQDEQTGGQFAEALSGLRNNENVWMVLQNGVHVDSLSPSLITDWGDFLNLFVAGRIPEMPGLLVAMGSTLYDQLADAPSLPIVESAYAGYPKTSAGVAQARAEFREDNPRLRLLMDNGAATVQGPDQPDPGQPAPGGLGALWEVGLDDYPVPGTDATTWYLGEDGSLTAAKPSGPSEVSYTSDPAARPVQTLPGSGDADAWKAQPPYDWTPVAAGKGLGFTSPALASDTLIAGPSSLDLELKSSAADTDLQVAITEVRPDGNETYIQSGWLRASHRKLDPKKSTALDPVPTHQKRDAANLPAGRFTTVRIPIYPVSHMFRAGSKVRVTVTAPGGDRPRWRFQTIEDGSTDNTVRLGGVKPSKLVLPVIPGVGAPGVGQPGHELPAVSPRSGEPGKLDSTLRGQPARIYEAATNGG